MKKGFSLIELMIMVAILGILAKIAISLYFNQIQRSNKSMVVQTLQQNIARMENYYSKNGQYLQSGNLWPGNVITSVVGVNGAPVYSITFYPSTASSANAQAYCLMAAPVGNVTQSDQVTLYMDRYGNISTTAPSNCSIVTGTNLVCQAGGTSPPCSGNCSNGVYSACSGNCSNVTICAGGTGCSGNCNDSIIYGGGCSGNCNNSIVYGGCSGNCKQGSIVYGGCTGNCQGSTCCDSSGNCSSCKKK
jgi:type IV pilus assembly protein PilE